MTEGGFPEDLEASQAPSNEVEFQLSKHRLAAAGHGDAGLESSSHGDLDVTRLAYTGRLIM